MRNILPLLCLVALAGCVSSLVPAHRFSLISRTRPLVNKETSENIAPAGQTREAKKTVFVANMLIGPQLFFVATIVGSIIAYIGANIEEIKMKQQGAVDKAMLQQKTDINAAQEGQKAAIKKAQEQQAANARRIADEARARADALRPK